MSSTDRDMIYIEFLSVLRQNNDKLTQDEMTHYLHQASANPEAALKCMKRRLYWIEEEKKGHYKEGKRNVSEGTACYL